MLPLANAGRITLFRQNAGKLVWGNASKLRKSLRVIVIDNDCDLLEVACHRLIESGVMP
jgi:hypothetical protein